MTARRGRAARTSMVGEMAHRPGAAVNPYDEVPYRSQPIEWTAPERLAVASLLHGGPGPSLDRYRVLELGCGNGANLVPLAYYRRHGEFVGVDGSADALAVARARARALALPNVELVHCDFQAAGERLSGTFDFIMAHGVLSWVPAPAREALLAMAAARLRPQGLVYLDYNSRPGWDVRGLVRSFLLDQTAGAGGLRRRAERAQESAARMAAALGAALTATPEHPYTHLLSNEFRYVSEADLSYVAHEYLSPDNQAFWHSEIEALAGRHGLVHVASADFNYPSGRTAHGLAQQIAGAGLEGRSVEDTVDLLSYRQHRTALFTHAGWTPRSPADEDLRRLRVAACLAPVLGEDGGGGGRPKFRHPSGFEVETSGDATWSALERLLPLWPRGLALELLFPDVAAVRDDLLLLHRHGMVELRLVEPGDFPPPVAPLRDQERAWGYFTTPYHVREAVAAPAPAAATHHVTDGSER